MFHIMHFVLVLSFAVGVTAIAVSAQMYRRHRLGYLRAHLGIVISFNLMIFVSIIALYIFNLPPGSLPEVVLKTAGAGHLFLVPLLQILAAYFLLNIIAGLLDRPVSPALRNTAWAIVGGYAALQATALATSLSIGGVPLPQVTGRIAWFFSLGAIYLMLITSMPQVRRIGERDRRRALKAYWYVLLGFMTLVICLILMNTAGLLKMQGYNLVTGFVIFAMNAVPVLYLRWFVEKFHVRRPAGEGISGDPKDLFERYNISPREQEVINLICRGKTNGEIADELFISLQTVKDHVYRIYRKTGVKNRVQLANLFMRPE
jgi:DNA-binding CsgD family transcriptional regulator